MERGGVVRELQVRMCWARGWSCRLRLVPLGGDAMGVGQGLVAGSVAEAGAMVVAGYWGVLQGVSGPLGWLLDRRLRAPLAPRGLLQRLELPESPGLPE